MDEDARVPGEERDLFRSLVEHSLGLMCVHDLEGNLLFVNTAAAETLGFRPEDGIGWNLRRFLTPAAQDQFDAYLARIRANGVDSGRMSLLSKHGGERIWQYRNILHEAPGVPARVLGHAQDVTESVRAREALEMAHTQRIESLGVLAGGVAHEFNNLLTVIAGRIQLLLDRLSGDEPARRDLHLIQGSAQRAAELTHELLAFGRRQLLQPRLIDLNEFIEELALPTRVGRRIDASFHLEEPLRQIHADPGQLKRALLHLVEHACEAMPDGGRLGVETANVDLDEAFVHAHPGAAVGPHVRVTIRDTGRGLDEATLSRLFEPFFAAKRGGQGSGLSLPVVHGIAAQHGGHIAVESGRHSGTAFMLYLPAVAGTGRSSVGTAARGPGGPRGTETILLIDRDKDMRLLLRDILEPHGYRVIEAAEAVDALAIATRRAEPIHLILANLGEDGGIAALDPLRTARPDAKILCVSAHPATHPRAAGPPMLQKPFTVLHLLGKVRDVLDGRDR